MKDSFKSNAALPLTPAATMHVAVHVQGQFFNPPAPRPSEEARQPEVTAAARRIENAAARMHEAGIPTLWSIKEGVGNMDMSAETKELYEVQPREGDAVIPDVECSALCNDRSQAYLAEHKPQTLILSGGYTSICMAETAAAAIKNGYRVIVMEDCAVDFTADTSWHELRDAGTRENPVVFMKSEEVLEQLGLAASVSAMPSLTHDDQRPDAEPS